MVSDDACHREVLAVLGQGIRLAGGCLEKYAPRLVVRCTPFRL